MNRSQRRQAERDMKQGVMRHEKIIPLPALLDEFTVFDMPQSILDQLGNGAIDSVNDEPIFRDNRGEICAVVPALEGWIFTWQKIQEKQFESFDLEPLQIVCNRLKYDMKLSRLNIEMAQEALDRCRSYFRHGNRKDIASVARTAQIQMMMGH